MNQPTNQPYRIFVGAFPTGELAGRIQAVREHYDPKTALITPPHVTLAGTYWRSGRDEQSLINKLRAIERQIPSFELILGGICTFGQRVVYLNVEPSPDLLAARQSLLGVMGQDKHRHFRPHLTLAMRLSPAGLQTMRHELQQSEWQTGRYTSLIQTLYFMQRGPTDLAWQAIAHYKISQS